MHMDPLMPQIVGAIFMVLLVGMGMKLLGQPHVIAYLVTGIAIGPFGLEMVSDTDFITRLGAVGVVMLLFFVGMETDAAKLAVTWKLSIGGTLLQIVLSVACVWLIGYLLNWPFNRVLLIGFVISLSSTAVVITLLQNEKSLDTPVGRGVLGILLAQDLAIIPMLIVLGLVSSGNEFHWVTLIKQALGTFLASGLFYGLLKKNPAQSPFLRNISLWIRKDRELELFAALLFCFGFSLITAWLELSTALGAFLAGMVIGAAKETQWVHSTLEPFKVLFVALFFVSVGLLLDVDFFRMHWIQVCSFAIAALLTNTFINALVLRLAKFSNSESLLAGLLLSQIGEFSFVLATVGFSMGIINSFGQQMAICVISLSLLVSPVWISLGKRVL